MEITRVEIRKLRLPLTTEFKYSLGELTHKETVITSLYTKDGLVGYGESSTLPAPIYYQGSADECIHQQADIIAPRIIGTHFASATAFRDAYKDHASSLTAQTGPECAFWHLLAQEKQVSLTSLLGGSRTEIPVGESIGIKDTIEETLQEVEQRLNEGFIRVKVKIKPGWDITLLTAIREKWPAMDLAVDGNAGYRLDMHEKALRALDSFRLSMIEQPLAADDLTGHAALQHDLKTPICLDESIATVEDMATATSLHACKMVNIKPIRVGGLVASLQISEYATDHNIRVWCGGMFETGIGRAFNIALAAREAFTYPADMSPYQFYFAEDLIEPSYIVKPNGHIDVPEQPGLGYIVQTDRIEKYTVEKRVVS